MPDTALPTDPKDLESLMYWVGFSLQVCRRFEFGKGGPPDSERRRDEEEG
jgi:hypothetical protein